MECADTAQRLAGGNRDFVIVPDVFPRHFGYIFVCGRSDRSPRCFCRRKVYGGQTHCGWGVARVREGFGNGESDSANSRVWRRFLRIPSRERCHRLLGQSYGLCVPAFDCGEMLAIVNQTNRVIWFGSNLFPTAIRLSRSGFASPYDIIWG